LGSPATKARPGSVKAASGSEVVMTPSLVNARPDFCTAIHVRRGFCS
jgi:hypothetical protein